MLLIRLTWAWTLSVESIFSISLPNFKLNKLYFSALIRYKRVGIRCRVIDGMRSSWHSVVVTSHVWLRNT